MFGPPPPSVTAIWAVALVGGLVFVAWSAWFDRHRALLPVLLVLACGVPSVFAQSPGAAERAAAADADRRRLMTQLGIEEPPPLPPLAADPHRPSGLVPREGSTTSFTDDAGNVYVRSEWGAWSNYDEAKAGPYSLPDPLRLEDGRRVTTAAAWRNERRPELLRLFATEIYGRIPADVPKVSFQVLSLDRVTYAGRAIVKKVIGRIDNSRLPGAQPLIDLTMYLPPAAPPRIPVVVMAGTFFGRLGPRQLPPQVEQVLGAGWAFATLNTSALQEDSGAGLRRGIIGLVNAGRPRAADDWGVLAAWSWGLSRALDYLQTDPAVDATRAAVQGHSRWGKTALLAGALDERWAVVWASCSGAMGASLERRNWGETIDNVAAANEYHWMAGNFLQYAGRWQQMPVDAHQLVALVAPRPVFITGGTEDQWSDPHGEFLAARAADPVYRLLGTKGLGTVDMPPPDLSLVSGELAYREHRGGHTDAPDWPIFMQWAKRYLDPGNHGEGRHGGRGAKH
jgi:hypothetical protein